MKTRVWQVVWGLKDGGAENLAREYAQLLDKDRYDTTIVTMYPFIHTANYQKAMDAGLRVISVFKRRNAFSRAVRVLCGKWYIPFVLRRLLTKEKPDLIHFNSQMAKVFLPAKKKLVGKRLVYTCHNEVQKHFFTEEEAAVRALIGLYDLRLIGLHEQMRKELNTRFGVRNTVIIRNGVDIDRFRACTRPNAGIRELIGIPQGAFVVGHVGRFSLAKNHEFLLNVFKEILQRNDDAHLLLIGNGELEGQIKQQIAELRLAERVTILSHRTDIPELLSAMDVMVFPSFFEGLPVTLVEAQASGLRCIVSDVVNKETFLLDTTIPMSLDSGVSAWADAALDDSRRCTEHGNVDDYDMKKEIRRLERVYCGYNPE